METCTDCHGKGATQLFTSAGPCKACGGTGKVGTPDSIDCTFTDVRYMVHLDGNMLPTRLNENDEKGVVPALGQKYPTLDFSKITIYGMTEAPLTCEATPALLSAIANGPSAALAAILSVVKKPE